MTWKHQSRVLDIKNTELSKASFTRHSYSAEACGQSYKTSTIVIYDSRVVPDLKLPNISTLES